MKKLLLSLLIGVLLAVYCLVPGTPANAAMTLARDGKTSYTIVLASDAIPSEKTAALQLQGYLQQITGAPFPIKTEGELKAGTPQLLVGAGPCVKALLPQQDWNSLGSDGIVIKTVGDDLILAGERPRGTLYAVFQFLEEIGCRWWTPTEKTIKSRSTLIVPEQNVTYTPPFSYREHYTDSVRLDPAFATIMRQNGHHQPQTEEWGGHYNLLGFVHTFSKLLPPEEYFKEHPEWYSDPKNGNLPCTQNSEMPAAQATQLNLSEPKVLEELTRKALVLIEENPQAGYISISQNDNQNYCRDAASMKLAQAEGSQAAPVLDFVNKVAARIHEKYPDFKVETLAYYYTVTPPKTIRPGKNVILRLAPIGSDYGHPLDSDWNAQTRDNLLGWAKIAPELFVWNYVTNFQSTLFPHPNWEGLGPDLRFFARNNVKGIFQQGDRYTGGVGDFVQLRAWLMGKLMWNPDLDQAQLTNEFLQGYYGAAAPYLKQYLDEMQQAYLAQNRKLTTYNQDFTFISVDTANKAMQLFDQAQAAVQEQPPFLQRVQRERLSLRIAVLYRYNALKRSAADEGKVFAGPANPYAEMEGFIKMAQAFDIRNWNESVTFESQVARLSKMFTPRVSLPEFAQNYPEGDVIDLQPSNFRLYRPGSVSQYETDAAASGGTAASIVGNTKDWAIQIDLNHHLNATAEKWRIYVMARAESQPNAGLTGPGFAGGAYDIANRKTIYWKTIPLSELAGARYRRFDLGPQLLHSRMYIWIAPVQNAAMEKVYIDRVVLIKEK